MSESECGREGRAGHVVWGSHQEIEKQCESPRKMHGKTRAAFFNPQNAEVADNLK